MYRRTAAVFYFMGVHVVLHTLNRKSCHVRCIQDFRRCALEVPAYTVETQVPLSWESQVPELENPSMTSVGYGRQAIRFPCKPMAQ